jgi:hypothetical protein
MVFGNLRLDVMIAVQESGGLITLTGLASELAETPSALQGRSGDMQDGGMLRPATVREMVAGEARDSASPSRRSSQREHPETTPGPNNGISSMSK